MSFLAFNQPSGESFTQAYPVILWSVVDATGGVEYKVPDNTFLVVTQIQGVYHPDDITSQYTLETNVNGIQIAVASSSGVELANYIMLTYGLVLFPGDILSLTGEATIATVSSYAWGIVYGFGLL